MRRTHSIVLALLLVLALALAGCARGDAIAHERSAPGSAEAETSQEAPTRTAEQAAPKVNAGDVIRDGEALGKLDRMFESPLGGTKIN